MRAPKPRPREERTGRAKAPSAPASGGGGRGGPDAPLGGCGGTPAPPPGTQGRGASGPVTDLHYASNNNFDSSGNYVPGHVGFNLADLSSVRELAFLPSGVRALVWLGLCNGADPTFIDAVQPFIGNPKVFAFYLMDEPDPTGQRVPLCPAANLMSESDWIHAHVPGAKTFIVI